MIAKRAAKAVVAMAVAASVAIAPSIATARRDKDCSDFPSQKAAQIFFLKDGGPRYDPDRLDEDHDGIACEDNPAPYYFKKHLP
jgi:hypothetical protein